jgi:hypothetical protein
MLKTSTSRSRNFTESYVSHPFTTIYQIMYVVVLVSIACCVPSLVMLRGEVE